jgi:APA family basic amino acid/polyamine antiporter
LNPVPHLAELAVGVTVVLIVALADLRTAIGFSSVTALAYYAIANASAFTLPPGQRTWPRLVPIFGFVGCLTIALALPIRTVVAGGAVRAAGAALYALRKAIQEHR